MKKNILFLTIAAILSFISCNKQESVHIKKHGLSVKLAEDIPATVYPGDRIDFSFNLVYEDGISEAYATIDGKIMETSRKTYSDIPKSATFSFSYEADDTYAGNSIDFAVIATGADGTTGRSDVPVFILAAKPDINFIYPENMPEEFMVEGLPLEFDLTIKSGSIDMKQLTAYKNDETLEEMSYEIQGDKKNHTLKFSYLPTLGDTGSPVNFSIEVMDVNGNITATSFSIQFTKIQSSELDEYSGIMMGLNKCKTSGQFFDAVHNKVYMANGVGSAAGDIDFALFWSGNSTTIGVAIASPNASNVTSIYPKATIVDILGGTENDIPANWSVRNETNFRSVSINADEFAGIMKKDEIIELFDNAEVSGNDHVMFKNKAGQVLVFKLNRNNITDGTTVNKYGILRITQVQASNNAGTITFDYKIEK